MDKEDKLFWALDMAGSRVYSEHKEAMKIIVDELNAREKVVHCKDCVHRPVIRSKYEDPKPPVRNGRFDESCPYICRQKWDHSRMPKDDDFCSKGEADNKEGRNRNEGETRSGQDCKGD